MYTGYATTAALALRAKRTFALNHIRVSDDDCSCGSESYHGLVSTAGVSVSPRVRVLLYGYHHWRHSTLVRCVLPSQRIVSVSHRYCRGVSPCSQCCCCCGNGGEDVGRFNETLGLLAEAGGGGGMGREIEVTQVGKFGSWNARGGRGRKGYDGGRRGMRNLGSNYWSELATEEQEEEFRDKEDYGRWVGKDESFSRVRRSGEDRGRERISGSSSRFRSSYSGEKEMMGSRKEAESKVRGKGRISSSMSTSAYQARNEERDQEEQRKLREELQKISNTSKVMKEPNGVEVSDSKVENKEETSALAVKLLDEVRKQRSEIDELNKNYQALLLKGSEEDRVASVRAAASSNTSSSRLEGSEQISTAILSLVDELKKQRVEIDRLLRSHQELTTTSKICETDNVRISHSNKAFVSRLEDREECTTSTLNLIEEDSKRHCHAEQLRGEHRAVAQSPQKRESIAQKVSGADSSSVLELNNRNESSTSVVSSVDKIKEKYSYSDLSRHDYEKFTESSGVHKINSNRVSTSNKVAITGLRGREQSSILDSNLVEGRRESSLSMVSDTGLECKNQMSALETNFVEERKASTSDKNDITSLRSREQSSTIDDDKRVHMQDKVTFTSFQDREQSSTLDANVVNDRRESMSNKISLTGFQVREKSSTLNANLVDEGRESMSNKVSSTGFQSREKSSSVDANLVEDRRVSTSNKVTFAKLQGREQTSTLDVNLIEDRRASSSNKVSFTSLQGIEQSSTLDASLVEDRRASTSNKVTVTRLQGIEQSSTTDATYIDGRRTSTSDKVTMTCLQGGDQSSTADSSLVEDRRASTSNKVTVTRLQGIEQSSTTDATYIDGRRTSTSDKVTMTCLQGGDQSSTADSSLLEKRGQHQNSLVQVRIDNNMLMQTPKMHDVGTERAPSSEESISRSRYEEKNSDSAVDLFGERSEQLGFIDQFKEDEYNLSKSAGAQKGDIDSLSSSNASDSNRSSISKSSDVEKGSISGVNMIREGNERHYYAYQETVGSEKMADLSEVEGRIIASSTLSGMESENAGQSSVLVQEAEARPEVCLFQRGKGSAGKPTVESFARISDGISGTAHQDDRELHEQGGMNEQVRIEHDMLESAMQFDNSSSLYVGEIVNELREMLHLDESDAMPKYSSRANMEITLLGDGQTGDGSQQGVVGASEGHKIDTVLHGEPGQTLASSEEEGPSDEMWDLTDPSSMASSNKEKAEKEASEVASGFTSMPATSQTAVVKRSGRSMWTFIANLIRMGWITRAKYQRSIVQSSTQSTSNESVSNDAWFSSHEHDEEDDHTQKGRQEKLKEPLLSERPISQKLSGIEVLGQEAEAMSENRLAKEHAGRSQFVGTTGRNNVSIDSSTLSKFKTPTSGGKFEVGISVDTTEDVLPSIVVDSSPLPMTQLGMTGIHTRDMHRIGFTKPEEPFGGNITAETEVDSDLRKRKFQRNKQIPREKFDEWEEAHKLELEQRKSDEFFMREALIEAKKAAEIWEVPIGAVLVQNGNVIARGSNLVEELRDSTAHAEMICIREASSLLRTWRLSDTTLYVTLEPCPMCAGAILQARVDTVVWGAPNKLLGADGSWVRLFPGEERKDDPGESSQSSGPVHPFHPTIKIRRGVLATECSEVMQQFFQLRRKDKKKEDAESSRLSISSYPNKLFTRIHGIFSMMFCL